MKISTLILFVFSLSLFTSNAKAQNGYGKTDIVDLALIYHGGEHRSAYSWTKDRLKPYVVHESLDGEKDWLFDGFLFLEFKNGLGHNYAPGYDKLNARKSEWEWLLDRQFAKDTAFFALNEVIGEQVKVIGKPHFKHKFMVGMPSPILDQKDWGSLNGNVLDFSVTEDRIEAGKWYIDQFLDRLDEADFENLQFTGFYWVDEDVRGCADILEPLGDYVRSKGLKFYWIPYWKAQGYDQWRTFKFDFAWLQPNHFFNNDIPNERIDQAAALAKELGMGVEMEFDQRALMSSHDLKRDRLVAYIEAFDKHDIFETSSIAYYQGGDAIYQLAKSDNVKDREILDELAKRIIDRKSKKRYRKLLEK